MSETGSAHNIQVFMDLQQIYWRGTQGDKSLLDSCVENVYSVHMYESIFMGDFTCVKNEKKAVFSFYPGLAIYSRQVIWRKELNKVTYYCQ